MGPTLLLSRRKARVRLWWLFLLILIFTTLSEFALFLLYTSGVNLYGLITVPVYASRKIHRPVWATTEDRAEILTDRPKTGNVIESDFLDRLQNSIPVNNLTRGMHDRALLWKGNTAKLVKTFREAIVNKRPISMATIGGSISAGGGIKSSCEFPCLHMEIVAEWLRTVLDVPVESKNCAMSGANSEYYAHCLDAHVDMANTDIIIGEVTINDRLSYEQPGFNVIGRPLEELLRNTIRHADDSPAFIVTGFVDSRLLFDDMTNGHICSFPLEQDYYIPLLKYYDITGVSLHRAVCPVYDVSPGFLSHEIISYDYFHPSVLSHSYVASILINFFANIIEEALKMSLPAEAPKNSLPPPLFNSTYIIESECFTNTHHVHLKNNSDLSKTETNNRQDVPFRYLKVVESKGFEKYFVNTSVRRYNKNNIMEHRNDVVDGFKCRKVQDWITIELVALKKPSLSAEQGLSIAYVECQDCDRAIISVWIGTYAKPVSPTYYFKTLKGSAGIIVASVDGLNLSNYVKEGKVFNVTLKLNWDYDFIIHAAMVFWRQK